MADYILKKDDIRVINGRTYRWDGSRFIAVDPLPGGSGPGMEGWGQVPEEMQMSGTTGTGVGGGGSEVVLGDEILTGNGEITVESSEVADETVQVRRQRRRRRRETLTCSDEIDLLFLKSTLSGKALKSAISGVLARRR